jgi:steroid 5-alpha reductase family enzyme
VWLSWITITAALGFAMTGVWLLAKRWNNVSVIDPCWAACVGVAAVSLSLLGPGDPARRALMGGIGALYAFRLTWHLVRRFRKEEEDPRYTEMVQGWQGPRQNLMVFGMFILQGVVAGALALPFALMAWDPSSALSPLVWLGLALAAVGVGVESVADRQLKTFKQLAQTRGQTCRVGLWRYSRHPNYFGDWLVWCGFALAATPSLWPLGLVAWFSPALMLHFFWNVTGIPATENHSRKTRGASYEAYIQETSAFFPWPPRTP